MTSSGVGTEAGQVERDPAKQVRCSARARVRRLSLVRPARMKAFDRRFCPACGLQLRHCARNPAFQMPSGACSVHLGHPLLQIANLPGLHGLRFASGDCGIR